MPSESSNRIRVEVLVENEQDIAVVRSMLAKDSSESEIKLYEGMIIGWVSPGDLRHLKDERRIVRVISPRRVEPDVRRQSLESALPQVSGLEAAGDPDEAPSLSIRVRGPMRPEWVTALHNLGLSVIERSGPDSWLVAGTPPAFEQLATLDWVVDFGPAPVADEDPDPLEAMPVTPPPTPGLENIAPRAAIGPEAAVGLESMQLPATPRSVPFDVSVFKQRSLDRVRTVLTQAGLTIRQETDHSIRFEAPLTSDVLQRLKTMSGVRAVRRFRPPQLLCDAGLLTIGASTAAGPAGVAPWTWNGDGETIGVLDSGVDDQHPDLKDVGIQKLSMPGALATDTNGHGTHVCGIAFGRGNTSVTGVAPKAKAVVRAMIDADGHLILTLNYDELFQPVVDAGAKVLNLSWGWAISGFYDQGAAQVDRYARQHPDVLFVIAAGNEGRAPAGERLRRLIGSPASAKNAITVGACTLACPREIDANGKLRCTKCNLDWGTFRAALFPQPPFSKNAICGPPLVIAGISSRGPTRMNSIKPDLLAPGVLVESARSQYAPNPHPVFEDGCPVRSAAHSACMTGTSMATPFVSGAAALVRQWARAKPGIANPSGAFLKACLVSCASRIPSIDAGKAGAPGYPDFDQGFGVLDLSRLFGRAGAAPPGFIGVDVANDSAQGIASRVEPGSVIKIFKVIRFEVPAGATGPMRVCLTWADLPGNAIQNSLQLTLETADGNTKKGNEELTFARDPIDPDAGDPNNTVQVVDLAAPTAGVYRATIFALNTLFPNPPGFDPKTTTLGSQGFALVITGPVKILPGLPGGPVVYSSP